ncbi:MAG TPA: PhoU domain-containing protein [Thermoplasmata archaeon]|nr:PhoU domain-containing protein [Thermoplasmata archaeon]
MKQRETGDRGRRTPPRRSPPAAEYRRHLPARAPTVPVGAERTVALTVRAEELPEHLFRRLLGAYLGGADSFVVHETPEVRPATRAVVGTFCRRTAGPAVVRDGVDELRLAVPAEPIGTTFGPRLRAMGDRVLEVHRAAVRSWTGLPLGEDGSWERRDDAIDREAWHLQREAARRLAGGGDLASALGAWTIARSLERIADHAIALGELGGRLAALPAGHGSITSLEQFHGQAMEHLEGVLAATDEASANDLLDTGEALIASGRALADRLLPAGNDGEMPPATAAAVARILESIGRTVAYAQDIAQVVLDRSPEVAPAVDVPHTGVILTAR